MAAERLLGTCWYKDLSLWRSLETTYRASDMLEVVDGVVWKVVVVDGV